MRLNAQSPSVTNQRFARLRTLASKPSVRTGFAFFLAAVFTAATVWWNTTATLRAQLDDGLLLARQIASQGEALVLDSYSSSTNDPLARAAQILSQGIDPRMIKVAKVEHIAETVWPTLGRNRVPAGIRERWNFAGDVRRLDF